MFSRNVGTKFQYTPRNIEGINYTEEGAWNVANKA
jgi:hypothetical protein